MKCLFLPVYLPVYFQACKLASPIASGVDCFGIAYTIAPFGMILGTSVTKTGRYRPQLWQAWAVLVIAGGLLTTLHADSSRSVAIGFEVLIGLGLGTLIPCTFFPVLAPIPVELNAPALAFFMFLRFMAQVSLESP